MQQFERTLHDAVTWYLVGVIWLVQLVHYPMFEYLDWATFARSHAFHTAAITIAVLPGMLLELYLASIILFRRGPTDLPALLGFCLVILIWAMTFFVMVPIHGQLGVQGYQLRLIQSLIRWNWVRTIAWTVRGLIAAFWL